MNPKILFYFAASISYGPLLSLSSSLSLLYSLRRYMLTHLHPISIPIHFVYVSLFSWYTLFSTLLSLSKTPSFLFFILKLATIFYFLFSFWFILLLDRVILVWSTWCRGSNVFFFLCDYSCLVRSLDLKLRSLIEMVDRSEKVSDHDLYSYL